MKSILFFSFLLSFVIAQAQQLEMHILPRTAAPAVTSSAQVPQLEMVIGGRDPNLAMRTAPAQTTEAKALVDCSSGCDVTSSQAPKSLASIQDTAQYLGAMNVREWSNACRGFVDKGQIGQYGQLIRSEIMKDKQLDFIKRGDADLVRLCPNYTNMNDAGKANVFLIIMTAMAFEESTCNNNITARGPNGTLKGLFQLHLGKEASYGPECDNFDSRTPEGSIMCSLSIINKQMGQGNLFRQQSNHWDVLRPKRWVKATRKYINNPSYAQIRSAISDFAPCHQKQSTVRNSDADQIYQVIDQRIYHRPLVIEL